MGLRRAAAVLLLLAAIGLVALGVLMDLRAAVLVLAGAGLAAAVVFLDVDELKSRG